MSQSEPNAHSSQWKKKQNTSECVLQSYQLWPGTIITSSWHCVPSGMCGNVPLMIAVYPVHPAKPARCNYFHYQLVDLLFGSAKSLKVVKNVCF